jgi:hypothetical protein
VCCGDQGKEHAMTNNEIATLMNETAGQHWGDEAHFQRFAVALEKRFTASGAPERRSRRTPTLRPDRPPVGRRLPEHKLRRVHCPSY